MAISDLGIQSITNVRNDGPAKFSSWVSGAINHNSVNQAAISFLVPGSINTAILARIVIITEGPQTHHPLDENERGILGLYRGGRNFSNAVQSTRHSNQLETGSAAVAWTMEWTFPLLFRVRTGDRIQLNVPPADDGGSPTGDYQLSTIEFTDVIWQ